LKILQVISSLGNGGAEKFVVELSNKLSGDHDVVLCSFRAIEDTMQFPKLLSPACKVISLNKKKGFDARVYLKLYRLIKSEKPQVIHFHLDATIKYLLPFVLLFPQIQFVHTLHSNINNEKRKVFRQWMRLKLVVNKIKLVCIAPNILHDFENEFPGFKFYHIDNGINTLAVTEKINDVKAEIETLETNHQTKILVCVGKLDENKNQELLMEVLDDLKDENIIALLIGSDPSESQAYLKKLLAIKPENAFLLGAKANVADYLAHADAFVMTSLNEGLPLSALEAFSMGLPILSTPAGGLKSLVENGVNGFMAKDTSREEMKKIVRQFLESGQEQIQRIEVSNKKKFMSLYTMDACVRKYLLLYNKN
jgi:glycosyltransferase involved in cell wall biosynthesis